MSEYREIFRAIRKKNKLSQEEFGEALGVSRSAIGQVELGKNNMSGDMAIKISEKFGVSIEHLLSRDLTGVLSDLDIDQVIPNEFDVWENLDFHAESGYILHAIDKIEVAKILIDKFRKDKKLKAEPLIYDTISANNNLESLKQQFLKESNGFQQNPKFVYKLKKLIDACLQAIYIDLFNTVGMGYDGWNEYYKSSPRFNNKK
ncbi:helix-turn-helix domain-containing protein [Leeuwenhoekiella parthenopeia]|uniref:Helix-turn-helix domain-containing protein n=1 Tax=Leeuwenhoekiella parthenopeia TaxID=2890320 RepID=A0ABS8GNZ4_9FLAO|nr:helix-turn-helix transcriptional regulator [Leeuwenhoekiella parthenopeia]MCC4211709.1 helix-turn-helix domain-containing protein [Leeuwenhoekiella parthenopeia]